MGLSRPGHRGGGGVGAPSFCPGCGGFCGECREGLGRQDLMYWWRLVPFHPDCGPLRAVMSDELELWVLPEECQWRWCRRYRALHGSWCGGAGD